MRLPRQALRSISGGVVAGILVATAACAAGAVDPELAALPPDERIQTEILRALRAEEGVDHEAIRVEVRDGEVILAGVVSSYEGSRRALQIAADIDGVVQVVNRLRVIPQGITAASAPARGSGRP